MSLGEKGQTPNGRGHYSRHNGVKYSKRNYKSRFQARKALVRRILLDIAEMGTYPCTGGQQKENGKLHYHFGHSSPRERWEGWKDLQQYRFQHRVMFKLFAARRVARNVVTGKKHTGAHKGPSKSVRRRANARKRKEEAGMQVCSKHGWQQFVVLPGLAVEPTCIECV
jgi:hypothetical protein